jgi:putative DNA primase/helicase
MAGNALEISSVNFGIPTITLMPTKYLEKTDDGIPVCISTDKCAKAIEEEMHIKTIGKEMYFYENGVYRSGGEDIIRTYLSKMFFGIKDIDCESVSTQKAQNEIVYKLKALTRVKLNEFDKNIFIINMKNGLYNWNTGEFKEHTSEYPSLIQIPVIYNLEATCENIDKMLHIAAREKDIPKLYEFVAYMLYRGYPIQKLMVLFGPPHTGKSVFENIIVKFIGDENKSSISLQDMSRDKHAVVGFHGKLANISSELTNEMLNNTGMIKRLTSNTDIINARDLYKSWINFINFAKFLFATNILPPIGEDIAAFAKRVDMAIFDHVYTEHDQEFLDLLTTPQELSGLFNKVIKLLPDLIKRNAFTNQLTIAEATKLYSERSIPEEHFLNKFVHELPEDYAIKEDLYTSYVKYCSKVKLTPTTIIKFGKYTKKYFDMSNEDMRAKRTVAGITFAVWPNIRFDEKAFNKWLEIQD